jgi:hypothetical protein
MPTDRALEALTKILVSAEDETDEERIRDLIIIARDVIDAYLAEHQMPSGPAPSSGG